MERHYKLWLHSNLVSNFSVDKEDISREKPEFEIKPKPWTVSHSKGRVTGVLSHHLVTFVLTFLESNSIMGDYITAMADAGLCKTGKVSIAWCMTYQLELARVGVSHEDLMMTWWRPA